MLLLSKKKRKDKAAALSRQVLHQNMQKLADGPKVTKAPGERETAEKSSREKVLVVPRAETTRAGSSLARECGRRSAL